MSKRWNSEQYIQAAIKKYGNHYGYEKVVFFTMHDRVEIICPIHGSFWPKAYKHLDGNGCTKCGKHSMDNEEFFQKANEIHGQYTYPNLVLKGCKAKFTAVCPIHGPWQTNINDHIYGKCGCPVCGYILRGNTQRWSGEEFTERGRRKHNGYYGYEKVVYFGQKPEVEITCPKHGPFWQRPNDHIQGAGCPDCAEGKTYSTAELNWLASLNIPTLLFQYEIPLANKVAYVDGYDPVTNTVYEYHGSFWHGHPNVFPDRSSLHPKNGIPVEDLYEETLRREHELRDLGYIVISFWGP